MTNTRVLLHIYEPNLPNFQITYHQLILLNQKFQPNNQTTSKIAIQLDLIFQFSPLIVFSDYNHDAATGDAN